MSDEQWSQDVPQEKGNWWVWRVGYTEPVIVPVPDVYQNMPKFQDRGVYWWKRIVVPQPPGEVGE